MTSHFVKIAAKAALFSAIALTAAGPAFSAEADVASRLKSLNDLLAEQWQYQLKESPEFATILGDDRYNDRWSDGSLAHVAQQKKDLEGWLARFKAIDTTGFSEQDRLNQQLMVRMLKDGLATIAFKNYEMPIDQMSGVHLQLAEFVASMPFDTVKHYDDYIARLNAIPKVIDNAIQVAKAGEKDHLMPPKYLLEKVVLQIGAIADKPPAESAFGQPAEHIPDRFSAADQKRLHDAIIEAVTNRVDPAYRRLQTFVARDYAPKGRLQPGIWSLPDGDARYRFAIEQQTTTDKSPEAIYELGLAEVKRIEGLQSAIAQKLGYASLKAMRAKVSVDPKFHASSREEILDRYRGYIAQMEPKLPQLFGLLPKTRVEVVAVEQFREKEAPAAEYNQGTPDGSRPGRVYVNTGDFAERSLLTMESTAYHEGIPGHHMQISIAQTLPGLPPQRQQASYTAYQEGWALYAEQLGKEVGFYQDPYNDYGRLSDELLRADRLVLDTGVHYKHWTRKQMIDFFHEHSSEDEPDLQAETDRYITWPGQALAYKIGELKILELRQRAKTALGDKFDIKAFHDEILDGGALPLDVLETRVDGWIAAEKAKG